MIKKCKPKNMTKKIAKNCRFSPVCSAILAHFCSFSSLNVGGWGSRHISEQKWSRWPFVRNMLGHHFCLPRWGCSTSCRSQKLPWLEKSERSLRGSLRGSWQTPPKESGGWGHWETAAFDSCSWSAGSQSQDLPAVGVLHCVMKNYTA